MTGEGAGWETVIGVEIHLQLRTATKMFCGCRSEFGAPPNRNVCPVCLGLPGALPVPNREAVRLALRAALALECRVRLRSRFDRKNYFYPDLPKGYQITQYHEPLAEHGRLIVPMEGEGGKEREIRIRRLHLEEDSGKSSHDRIPGATAVDLNRAGVPLVEIVTEPDLRSPSEARAFLGRLKQTLEHYAAVSDCNMEEGSLRVDANLSVRRVAGGEPGVKTEVKNLNSFSHVEKALAFEAERQIALRKAGRPVVHETRLFDVSRGETRAMRGKEEDFDYRYFPEPDLPPLVLDPDRVERIRERLPEMPRRLEIRLQESYGLSAYDAGLLAAYPARAAYFEKAVGDHGPDFAKQVANFIMGPMAAEANRREEETGGEGLVPAGSLARLVELRMDGTLGSSAADRVLERMLAGEDDDPVRLTERYGLAQVRDTDRLRAWVEAAVAEHGEEASRYAAGETRLLGFFMGAVMREAKGAADPEELRRILVERLERVEAPEEA